MSPPKVEHDEANHSEFTAEARDPIRTGLVVPTRGEWEDRGDDVSRGIVEVEVPREKAGRFTGSLPLAPLSDRQPEIVFDSGRRYRDSDDE